MKKRLVMAALAAAVIMSGCSKEAGGPSEEAVSEATKEEMTKVSEEKVPEVVEEAAQEEVETEVPEEIEETASATQDNTEKDAEKEADELFAKAIAGEITVNATYEDGTDISFRIPDLPNDPEDYYCYKIGSRVDLDNDGVTELIIDGPYGGKYLDVRDGGVYQLAQGEGTAGQLYYADYNGKTYICHVDNSHGGRETFLMDCYNGNGEIVESTSLTAEYWEYVEFNEEAAICHFGDEEIPVERYLELRKEIFDY